MPLEIKIEGLEKALKKLHAAPENVKQHVGRGLFLEAELVMTDSKENFVPVVTGALRSSGHVERPKISAGEVSVTLGFGGPAAPYAFAVHENPRSGKTAAGSKVGQWKYLSTPLLRAKGRIRAVIASAVKRGIVRGNG